MRKPPLTFVAMLSIAVAGCAPGTPGTGAADSGVSQPRSPRTLIHAIRNEPDMIPAIGNAGGDSDPARYFNGTLATIDQRGEFVPMLA